MSIGTILLYIVGGFLLLVVLFLPLVNRLTGQKPQPLNPQEEAARTEAYRRGFIIGSLGEELHLMEGQLLNQQLQPPGQQSPPPAPGPSGHEHPY
jgi:hypothetical protein